MLEQGEAFPRIGSASRAFLKKALRRSAARVTAGQTRPHSNEYCSGVDPPRQSGQREIFLCAADDFRRFCHPAGRLPRRRRCPPGGSDRDVDRIALRRP
jgi:hypothetical protein